MTDMYEWRKAVEENLNNPMPVDEGKGLQTLTVASLLALAAGSELGDQLSKIVGELEGNIDRATHAVPHKGNPDPVSGDAWTADPGGIMSPRLSNPQNNEEHEVMNEIQRLRQLAGIVTEADTGDETEKTVVGHLDDERDMIKKQLFQMGNYCVELYKMLEKMPGDVDFPHWWQSKLIKADDYIGACKHYLENELSVPEKDPMDSGDSAQGDDLDPSGVS